MVTSVYVDVLITLNFIINYLLLMVTYKICGRRVRQGRVMLASILGAASSLTIFLPFLGIAGEALVKIGVSAAMLLCGNRCYSKKQFFKEWFTFFTASFLFAGIMLAIFITVNPQNMFYYNGVVYFHLSPFVLILNIAVAYGLVWLFDRLIKGSFLKNGDYDVTLSILGKEIQLRGFVDTGNKLKDPFTGTPVILCDFEAVKKILPENFDIIRAKGNSFTQEDFLLLEEKAQERFRMIPYHTVGKVGTVPAIRADYIQLKNKGNIFFSENLYVAISETQIKNGEYQVILNPGLLEHKNSKVEVRV